MPINKRSAEYWQKRFEQLEDAQNNKGLQYFKDLERIYGKAISETEKDIAKWYHRYAREEGISLAEAKKQLSKGELKEFRMTVQEYIEKGQSLLDPAWKRELERASTKFHVTRLEALKLQMQQNVEYLMGNEADGIDKLMRDIFTDSYYHSAYEIHKGLGIGWDLMKLDNKVIDKAMSNPWTADGTNFSKRIWGKYRPELVKKLHDGLTLNLIQGKRADKLIDDITKQFNVKRHQAENLVQTEKAYFQSLAQKDSFKAMNVKEYEIVATLDTKTSDICREMDGKVFKLDDFAPGATAPPFHNRCRTATAPFFDDEFEEDVRRAARDEDGKYYTVPANMKYQDWYDKFVNGKGKDGLKEVVIDAFKTVQNTISLNEKNVNDKIKVDKISKTKDFNELKDYIKSKYDVTVDKGIEKLNFNTVRSSLEGVESVIDEIPDVGKSLNKMVIDKSGVMSCTGEEISFNPKYFSDSETLEKLCKKYSDSGFWVKNVSPASIGVHETAHGIEWLMIEISNNYFHDFEKIEAWNKCTEAKAIVSQACKNIKKTAYGKGKKNDELINAISRYAGSSKSETMAEAFADVYANGENANPLSIEIKKLTLEKIKKYKGKV